MKRLGPIIAAMTGAALMALELLRPREGGLSVFWMSVGGLAVALGLVGHFQRDREPPEPPLPKL